MNTVEIQAGLSFSTKTLADGRIVPYVTSVDVKCNINRFDINIRMFGNIWTDLASLFEVFFVGTVAGMIEDTVQFTLSTGIPVVTNTIVSATDGYLPIPLVPSWVLDWETPESAIVTDTQFQLGIRALMFDKKFGEEEPAVEIPEMPYHMTEHIEKYQAYVSSYSIDAFWSSWLEVAAVKGWFNAEDLPEKAPFNMTTTTFNAFLPGIMSYYGPGQPVDIHFEVEELGQFDSQQANDQMSGVTTLTLEFWVETTSGTKEMAASMRLIDTDFAFSALINDMTLAISLSKVNVDSVNILSCSFGKLSAITMKLELNNFFRIFMPQLNSFLAKKTVTFPSNFFGIFKLTNLTLDYYDHYIFAGATPLFIAPACEAEDQFAF